jgi:hypothetical protein
MPRERAFSEARRLAARPPEDVEKPRALVGLGALRRHAVLVIGERQA